MSVGLRKRFAVLERDNFTCVYCGSFPPAVTLEVDHLVPRSRGGSDHISNLVASCYECNHGKSARVIERAAGDARYEAILDELAWAYDRLGDLEQHVAELREIVRTYQEQRSGDGLTRIGRSA